MKDEIDVYQTQIENDPFQSKGLAKATVEDHSLFSLYKKLCKGNIYKKDKGVRYSLQYGCIYLGNREYILKKH